MTQLPIDPSADRGRHPTVVSIELDSPARHIATNPRGRGAYATTAKSVVVIDDMNRVMASIPIGVDPERTIVSPDGTRIYVIGFDGSVSVIDAVNHTVMTTRRDASTAEVVNPEDNYLYSAHNRGRNSWISMIANHGTLSTVAPVDAFANALALSPDGGRLYVASSKPESRRQRGHGSVSVIDTATFALVDTMPTQFAPDTLAVSPDGDKLYATHYHRDAVSVIDSVSQDNTLVRLDDAPLDAVVSPDGGEVYVTCMHSLALINTATNGVESVPAGDLPRRLHVSGDRRHFSVIDMQHNAVWVFDPVDRAIVAGVDLERRADSVAFSADGRFAYVADRFTDTVSVIPMTTVHWRP